MKSMSTKPLVLVPALAMLAALVACDRPKPRHLLRGAEAPAWAQPLIGKPLREAFPAAGACKGNTDVAEVLKPPGEPAGVRISGWAWDPALKARVERVLLVDKKSKIVGAGESGGTRPDVPAAIPEIKALDTGWLAEAAAAKGALDAYGIVGDGDAVCPLGHIEF